MTNGKNRIMSGLHIVSKAGNPKRWYVYAYRGGPCIHKATGSRPVITAAMLDKAMEARRTGNDKGNIIWLAREYRNSPEFERLAPSSQKDYRRSLDRIGARFGDAPLGVFEDRRIRQKVIAWRDENWRGNPRTADKVMVMFATLLNWGLERGVLGINVLGNVRQLHHADRSDLIWEERHWEAMAHAPEHFMRVLTLASLTGLRRSDLAAVSWEHVGDKAIILVTKKRKGRAVIPILPELRAFLDALPHREGAILRNSRGHAWTPDGITTTFTKTAPDGFDRTLHDLRGTYVTWLCQKRLTDDEIARIVGWTAKRVADVRARYVDEARVIISLVDRLSA